MVLDEAQDLSPVYIRSLYAISRATYADVWLTGDVLQSILCEPNVFTEINNHELANVKIKRDNGVGRHRVRRFHHNSLQHFINDVIRFGDHGCIPIEGICNDNCTFMWRHGNQNSAIDVFDVPKWNAKNYTEEVVKRVLSRIDTEVNTHSYRPDDFIVISPVITQNEVLYELETHIQEYWASRIGSEESFTRYAYLHKSEENQPIDFNESKGMTRLMSIIAAKGEGVPVVFVVGLTDKSLACFSTECGNLKYESFLNVALTRSKCQLYIALDANGDNVYDRLKPYSNNDPNVEPCISRLTKLVRTKEIIPLLDQSPEWLERINHYLIPPTSTSNNSNITDYGHHIVRFSVINYRILSLLAKENFQQLYTIDNKLKKAQVSIITTSKEFYAVLKKQRDRNNKHTRIIPILEIGESSRVCVRILHDYIKNIQQKIPESGAPPDLCPLETVIYFYASESYNGFSTLIISPVGLNSLIKYYQQTTIHLSGHDNYGCLCSRYFKDTSKPHDTKSVSNRVTSHYELVNTVQNIYYKEFKPQLFQRAPDERFSYNMNITAYYAGERGDSQFLLSTRRLDYVGWSDKSVVGIYVVPCFSSINCNELLLECILSKCIIEHVQPSKENEHYDKFHGKKVSICIFSVNPPKAFFYHTDFPEFKEFLQYLLFTRYSAFSGLLFRLYNFHNQQRKSNKNQPNSIRYMSYKLASGKQEYDMVPNFVHRIFSEAQEEKCKKDSEYQRNFKDKDAFHNMYVSYLENELLSYLDLNNPDDMDVDNDF